MNIPWRTSKHERTYSSAASSGSVGTGKPAFFAERRNITSQLVTHRSDLISSTGTAYRHPPTSRGLGLGIRWSWSEYTAAFAIAGFIFSDSSRSAMPYASVIASDAIVWL